MVSGQKQPHLRNAVHEADRVGRMLGERMSVPVQPIIVLVDPKKITIRKSPERVKVLDARHLVRWLAKRPVILTPADQADVVSFLGQYGNVAGERCVPSRSYATVRAPRSRGAFRALAADTVAGGTHGCCGRGILRAAAVCAAAHHRIQLDASAVAVERLELGSVDACLCLLH